MERETAAERRDLSNPVSLEGYSVNILLIIIGRGPPESFSADAPDIRNPYFGKFARNPISDIRESSPPPACALRVRASAFAEVVRRYLAGRGDFLPFGLKAGIGSDRR
jgi:hypothetical protein